MPYKKIMSATRGIFTLILEAWECFYRNRMIPYLCTRIVRSVVPNTIYSTVYLFRKFI